MRIQRAGHITAAIITVIGFIIGLSVVLAVKGYSAGFAIPGSLLFAGYSWAAFYVPIFLFVCAFLLLSPVCGNRHLVAVSGTVVPFFTAGLLLHLQNGPTNSPAVRLFVGALGASGAAFFLFLLLALELVVLFRWWTLLFGGEEVRNHGFLGVSFRPSRPTADAVPASRIDTAVTTDTTTDASADEDETAEIPTVLREQEAFRRRMEDDVADFTVPKAPDLPPMRSLGIGDPSDDLAFEEYSNDPVDIDLPEPSSPAGDLEEIEEAGIDIEPVEGDDDGWTVVDADEGDFVADIEEDIEEDMPEEDVPAEAVPQEPVPLEPVPRRNPKKRRGKYEVLVDGLLDEYPDGQYWVVDEETKKAAEVLRQTLEEFKITAEVTGIRKGPVITMFEILPSPGVKLSKIVNLADNIALRLAASRVRIVAPIPGKHAVGIEVPNKQRAIVSFREMLEDDAFTKGRMAIPVVLGKDIPGDTQIVDLTQTPHLLIAGATGSGKSVCVNSLILSILCKQHPEDVKLMLIDPKIVELKLYNDIPHLLTPVITESKRAFQALQYCLCEMERRYSLLDSLAVRDIKSYNRKIKDRKLATAPLPYIVVVIDEFADLMASSGKELESTLARLAAMSRAVGLHLVLATQRPSIDVITGLIKANIPSRIAFMVAGKFDSRIIIDSVGAEKLLGKGDMLFTSAWDPHPIRIQGSFVSPEEVDRVVEHVKEFGEPDYIDDEIFIDDEDEEYGVYAAGSEDPLMGKALEVIATSGKASASYLQRRLKIGYNRAARLVEEMEMRGIVGPQNGSKPREVLHVPDFVAE